MSFISKQLLLPKPSPIYTYIYDYNSKSVSLQSALMQPDSKRGRSADKYFSSSEKIFRSVQTVVVASYFLV